MKRHYEATLPEGYTELYHIDARDKRIGLILNLIALGVFFVMIALSVLVLWMDEVSLGQLMEALIEHPLPSILFGLGMIAYIVAHELVHGLAYKSLTHQKLTFGMSWSCAFCGVPSIYVYRHASLVALLAPFVVFSVLFGVLWVWMAFVHPLWFLLAACLLGMHLGGCSGDLYMTFLLLVRFRSRTVLIRDTGPEQFVYDLPAAPGSST